MKDCWVKCAWRTVMGRSGEPVGAQLVGRDPGQPRHCASWRARPPCHSPRRIPQRQLPPGAHGALCPPFPRGWGQGAGRACERVCWGPGARAIVSGKHLPSGECAALDHMVAPPP